MQQLDAKKVAAWDDALKQLDTLGARAKGPAALEQAAMLKNDLMQRRNDALKAAAEAKMKAVGRASKDLTKFAQSQTLAQMSGGGAAAEDVDPKMLEKYGKRRALMSEAEALLDNLNASRDKDGMLPGTGVVAGRVNSALEGFGVDTGMGTSQQDMRSLVAVLLKRDSGAAVTEEEYQRTLQAYGLTATSPKHLQKHGAKLIEERFKAAKAADAASYKKGVVDAYERSLPAKAPTPKSGKVIGNAGR
jgi:hypothetical protein